MINQSPNDYRWSIEQKILRIIVGRLKTGEMKAPRARTIARFVLETLKIGMTLEEIHQIAPKLDQEFHELSAVALTIEQDYQEKIKQLILPRAEKLIRERNFQDATKLIKNTLR